MNTVSYYIYQSVSELSDKSSETLGTLDEINTHKFEENKHENS